PHGGRPGDDARLAAVQRDRPRAASESAGAGRRPRLRQDGQTGLARHGARPSDLSPGGDPVPQLPTEDLQWAIQRRLDDVFARLGEKFGDLTGRVETKIRPDVSFDDVGGLEHAKAGLRGFANALTNPDAYAHWGISPPRGVLLYGPPGTGKT